MHPAAPPSLRLFLALWPSSATLAALREHAQAWSWPPAARRTPPRRLHVTLHFLGDVPAQRLPALRQGLAAAWEGCELLLDLPQIWPGGIAVLEASRVPAALAALHQRLGGQLAELGLAAETRRFRPHVTLARKAVGALPPAGGPVRWQAAPGYALMRSLPGRQGYETLQSFG